MSFWTSLNFRLTCLFYFLTLPLESLLGISNITHSKYKNTPKNRDNVTKPHILITYLQLFLQGEKQMKKREALGNTH